jgi:hypothetical protein
LPTTAVQRLQRFTWLLSFAPHLGQRRFLSWWANFVRGRVFMEEKFLLAGWRACHRSRPLSGKRV